MTDKELKKISRAELLELLIEQMEKNKQLQQELDEAQKMLNDRQIVLQKAGSIAEAALSLNKVFEAADAAAKQYVQSVCQLVDKKKARADERKQHNALEKARTQKKS